MSRSHNKHHKEWNYPKREAKFYSNRNRRLHGKKLLAAVAKTGAEDNELAVDVPKNAGNGNIWNYVF